MSLWNEIASPTLSTTLVSVRARFLTTEYYWISSAGLILSNILSRQQLNPSKIEKISVWKFWREFWHFYKKNENEIECYSRTYNYDLFHKFVSICCWKTKSCQERIMEQVWKVGEISWIFATTTIGSRIKI